MWRVIWSPRSIVELKDIRAYIAVDNPIAAATIADRIVAAGDSLCEFPKRGRLIGRGTRQLSSVYPYQIRYKVRRDHVEIIAVRHGARR